MPPTLAGGSLPLFRSQQSYHWGFPGSSVVENTPANEEDLGLILWVGKVPWNGNVSLFHCLENPTDGRAWWAIQSMVSQRVGHDLATKQQQEQQSNHYLFVAYIFPNALIIGNFSSWLLWPFNMHLFLFFLKPLFLAPQYAPGSPYIFLTQTLPQASFPKSFCSFTLRMNFRY